MSRHKRYVREQLLDLIDAENPLEFRGRFLTKKNEAWITISQLTAKENSEVVLASHLNLPIHKLDLKAQNIESLKKGQPLSVKAKVSSYKSSGVTRATLVGFGPKNKIEVTAEIN